MIVNKFEQTVTTFPQKTAVKTGAKTLTYEQLNQLANRIARTILSRYGNPAAGAGEQTVGLLFRHGLEAVAAVIAVLKAGKIYVPLDATLPEKRLVNMLESMEIRMIIACASHLELAQRVSNPAHPGITIIDVENPGESIDDGNLDLDVPGDLPAYILNTSGSSGKPKGVVQNRKNVWFFVDQYIQSLNISHQDNVLFLSSFSHDGAVEDIFPALLSGATLCTYDIKEKGMEGLSSWLREENITVYHSVPTVFRYFVATLAREEIFPALRVVCMGAESLRQSDIHSVKKFFPNAALAHMYGQTESSVNTLGFIDFEKKHPAVTIGNPLPGVKLLLVDEEGSEVDILETGEIFVASQYLSPGYWKDPEETSRTFLHDEELGRLYRTGDLARIDYDGNIRFMGRKDHQVKIRGFRIEPGEIESVLAAHHDVKQALVTAVDISGDKSLCAYILPATAAGHTEVSSLTSGLMGYLGDLLPEYMVPSYFLTLEKIPVTTNGKVDRNALPLPTGSETGAARVMPANELEEKLAAIWAQVLNKDKNSISTNANFFRVGGHSLKATLLMSRIHKELNSKISLAEIFNKPTIKELAALIAASGENKFTAIPPVEKKDYYPLSSAQKRMFILNQVKGDETSDNTPNVMTVTGKLDRKRLTDAFKKIVTRHDILKTSFHLKDNEPLQIVHPIMDLEIEHYTVGGSESGALKETQAILEKFVRPFNLARAPLIRVGLVEFHKEKHLLMYDMHHIIKDGTSTGIIAAEFVNLYNGADLPELRIQYKDFASWQNKLMASGAVKKQQEYWLNLFSGDVPLLEMPTDYPRPRIQSFEGDDIIDGFGEELSAKIYEMAVQYGATLYMVLLAIYTVLLSKYSGQEDIVVGTPVAGRPHDELDDLIGMFANTLPMRNFPQKNKPFSEFLLEVKDNCLKAYENQDYQFEDMVKDLKLVRNPSRSIMFDTMFVLQNRAVDLSQRVNESIADLTIETKKFDEKITQFDLMLHGFEATPNNREITFCLLYSTKLFKKETIKKLTRHFITTAREVVDNPDILISQIELLSEDEKENMLFQKSSEKFQDLEIDFDF